MVILGSIQKIKEVSSVSKANKLIEKGWEFYKSHSHHGKIKIILVKRNRS